MNTKQENIRCRKSIVFDLIPFAGPDVAGVSFGEIVEGTGMSRSEIAFHLAILAKKGRISKKDDIGYHKRHIIVVRETGDAENDLEGGYNYQFNVESCEVGEEEGKLEWRRIAFPQLPHLTGLTSEPEERPRPPLFTTDHVRDYGTIGEDVIGLLQGRGVKVVILPLAQPRWLQVRH